MITSRVALVTGASSGFGQATAAGLSAHGFQVFGTSRAPLDHPVGSYEMLPLDVCSETSVQTCVETILQRTGRIVQLATSSRPPLRSYVGHRASLLVALRRWLPSQAFERVCRQVFHIEKVPAFDERMEPAAERR